MDTSKLKVPDSIANFGMVGERKAIALLSLGFFSTVFTLMALLAASQLPEWVACFAGLAACYAIGFFALAANWFWGRWFAVGLGYSGLTMAVLSVVTTRELNMPMVVFGVLHGLIAGCLLGNKMADQYEARADWKERWKLDDQGVLKVRRTVTRAASSLPSLIMFALAPREPSQGLAILALAGLGLFGLLRGRTWGVLVMFTAAVGAIVSAMALPAGYASADLWPYTGATFGLVGGALLATAVLPFVPPMASFLTRRSSH